MYFPNYTSLAPTRGASEYETLVASYRGARTPLLARTVQAAEQEINELAQQGEFGHGAVDIINPDTGCCRGAVTLLIDTVYLGFPCYSTGNCDCADDIDCFCD